MKSFECANLASCCRLTKECWCSTKPRNVTEVSDVTILTWGTSTLPSRPAARCARVVLARVSIELLSLLLHIAKRICEKQQSDRHSLNRPFPAKHSTSSLYLHTVATFFHLPIFTNSINAIGTKNRRIFSVYYSPVFLYLDIPTHITSL